MSKVSFEVDSLECGGYVSLDNPLYDKEFYVILAIQAGHFLGEVHPMALVFIIPEVVESSLAEILHGRPTGFGTVCTLFSLIPGYFFLLLRFPVCPTHSSFFLIYLSFIVAFTFHVMVIYFVS